MWDTSRLVEPDALSSRREDAAVAFHAQPDDRLKDVQRHDSAEFFGNFVEISSEIGCVSERAIRRSRLTICHY